VQLVAEDSTDRVFGVLGGGPKFERVPESREIEFESGNPVPQRVVLAHVPLGLLGPPVEGEEVLAVADVRQEVVLEMKCNNYVMLGYFK
jgi:hypothetical protein